MTVQGQSSEMPPPSLQFQQAAAGWSKPPSIWLLGAASTVTGSRYLATAGQDRVLVDCSLYQRRQEQWISEAPADIDAPDADLASSLALIVSGDTVPHPTYAISVAQELGFAVQTLLCPDSSSSTGET